MEHTGFQHQALIYESAEEYLAGTAPYLRAGLEAEQPVLVAVGPEQTELLRGELGADAELIRFVDMREVGRNPASIIPLWAEFVDEGEGMPVRGIGEPVWAARSTAALDECQRHESLLNFAFDRGCAWDLLCPYDAAGLGDEVLEQVARSHPLMHQNGRSARSATFVRDEDCFGGELPAPAATPEVLSFGLKDLTQARRLVTETAERVGMEPAEVADLVTATSELAANSVMHGGGSGTLRLWQEDERLLVEVEDRGQIEEPLVGRIRPDVHQEGGRGLWLANQLCDLVQIRSGEAGTTVRLHVLAREAAFV
ncbi:MAG TPA: anti-sigma factor RsbA family regulatory protein [Solirubrobacterales bacterium]|nr:anti-sigma factor RsbA family regulatory protein [Solirubrobacterales bacterium]